SFGPLLSVDTAPRPRTAGCGCLLIAPNRRGCQGTARGQKALGIRRSSSRSAKITKARSPTRPVGAIAGRSAGGPLGPVSVLNARCYSLNRRTLPSPSETSYSPRQYVTLLTVRPGDRSFRFSGARAAGGSCACSVGGEAIDTTNARADTATENQHVLPVPVID